MGEQAGRGKRRVYCVGCMAVIALVMTVRTGCVVAPENSCDFGTVRYGEVRRHRFILRNRSLLPAVIGSVTPACECTHAKVQGRRLPPFGTAFVDVTFNSTGFHGEVTRFVDVQIEKPRKRNLLLTIDLTVVGGPKKGLEEVLFSESCGKCHVKPGVGKAGKQLYDAVCQMCHTAGKGASPLLRGYWPERYTYVTNMGIPGTSMPGFSSKAGGKLTEDQIRSIADYFSSSQ